MTAAYETSTTAASLTRTLFTVAGTLALRAKQFIVAYKHRRDINMLAAMDERMLADIGLTRGDLRDAIGEPLWRDPSTVLVSRADERRANRRRTAFGLSTQAFTAPSIVPHANAGCGSERCSQAA